MVEETWSWRERPILEVALREVDAHAQVDFAELATQTGLDPLVVWRTVKVLKDAGYVNAYHASMPSGFITGISERTRRTLGSWPSPEALLDQLVRAFAEAAERETEPERKSRLRAVAEGLGDAGRTVALDLLAAFLRQQAGLP
jgi:DNA-binding Lrp family transcriptional regulator